MILMMEIMLKIKVKFYKKISLWLLDSCLVCAWVNLSIYLGIGVVESLSSIKAESESGTASGAGTAPGNAGQRAVTSPHPPAINLVNYSSDSDIIMSNKTRKQRKIYCASVL